MSSASIAECLRSRGARAALAALALVVSLALAPESRAQGCVLCRTAAEGSGYGSAINLAILVLLVPTLAIFAGILYRAYRHR